ncbi:MAG: Calx-beta domain-containing protein [Lutibacter sp.]
MPTATISYAGSPYCKVGSASVTQTGQSGGTYSSTAGLSLNSSTGAINLASSTAGTYTVTYSFTDGNGCSNTATASVTINSLPTATISYAGSPYCKVGTASVTQTGQSGGTYSSTAGLSLNSSTGAINLASSTAGTYTVIYSFTDDNSCSNTTSASVIINPLPTATISYAGSPYCKVGSASVTQTGQSGGTYSSTAGLSLNSSTGAINLASSTAGTYTVTYSFTDGNGCSNTATASVTINPLPIINQVIGTNPTIATCPTLNNGSITISATGSNLLYSINNGTSYKSSNIFNGLTSGTYQIVVKNSVTNCLVHHTENVVLTNPICVSEVSIVTTTNASEPNTNGLFTLTLTNPLVINTEITYTITGTASNGTDYTTIGTKVTILANQTSVTIPVIVIDDNIIEATETVIITLISTNTLVTIDQAKKVAIVTITDNDSNPQNGLVINDVTVNEGAGNATFSVTLTGNVQGGFTVKYETANGSAIAPGDYISTTGTLTFAGTNNEVKTLTVPIINDNLIEPTENFFMNLSELSTNLIGINDGQGIGTITDNDGSPQNGIVINDVTVNEGDGNATFNVTLTGNVQGGFTVNYATANGSAVAPGDYTSNSGMLTFTGTSGETKNITFPIIDDNLIEPAENFFVNLSNLSTTLIGINDGQGEGTINDNDNNPLNGLVINDVTVNESAGSATFNVTLTGNVQGGFTVNYATANGSALAPGDYTSNSGTLTFAGTNNEVKTITVPIIDDNLIEPSENFIVNLSNLSTTLIVINDNQGTGTITDNDGGPQNGLVINNVTVNENAGNATFNVTLTGNVQGGFTVNYATANGSALAPGDYTSNSGMLTFIGTTGETKNITVPIIDDNLIEPAENFFVNLSNLSTTLIGINDNQGTGTITDNDGGPLNGLTINNVTVNEGAGNATFNVTLTGNVQSGFTVNYATVNGSASALGDYTNTNGILTFIGTNNEVKTITVPIIDDNLIEPTENFFVNLSNLSTTLIGINDNQGTGTITDNDGGSLNGLTINNVTVNEGAGSATFIVTLTGNVQGGFTVNYATVNGSASAPGDYTNTNGTLTFTGTNNEVKTITVPIIDDNLIEPSENFFVNLSNLSTTLIGINDNQGIGTITDNDGGPLNGLTINNVTVNEGAGNATFTVTLTGNVQGGFTINYATENGSASAPGDYTSASGMLTFIGTTGETKTITVPIIDDNLIEPTENFFVNLSNLSTVLIGINDGQGMGTITDNDGGPQNGLVINNITVNENAGNAIFTVTLTGNVQGGFTVNYATVNSNASAPGDYSTTSETLTFVGTDGETHNIIVPIIDDNFIEPTENFFVNLSELSTDLIGINDDQGEGTITDNDGGIENGLVINNVTVNENAGNATFIVTLTGNVQGGFTVNYATANSSASAPGDYTTTSGTLNFVGTDGETHNIIVPIIDDNFIEPAENFFVNLSELSTDLIGINDDQGEGTITDNDGGSQNGLVINDIKINENGGNATFIVTLTGNVQGGFTVNYVTASGSALAPGDYTTTSGTLIFTGTTGETHQILVPIINNNLIETTENFYVNLSELTTDLININDAQGEGTIIDNDLIVTNDAATANDSDPITIDILANDSFGSDDAIESVVITSNPAHGTVTIDSNNNVIYTANNGYFGLDTFSYTLTVANTDESLNSGTAVVTVTVNASPNAADDLAETESNIPLDIDILDNDTDADGTIDPTSVTIIEEPENGTVVINTDGSVTYTPDEDFMGDDTFTYEVCDDDGLCDTATVSIVVAGVLAAELIIPEGFSPNDDGVHDEFDVEGLSNLYPDFKMVIYNRWGIIVYDYTHNGNPLSEPIWWDGYSRGRMTLGNGPAPVGTYFYTLYFNKDSAKPRAGFLYLNR